MMNFGSLCREHCVFMPINPHNSHTFPRELFPTRSFKGVTLHIQNHEHTCIGATPSGFITAVNHQQLYDHLPILLSLKWLQGSAHPLKNIC